MSSREYSSKPLKHSIVQPILVFAEIEQVVNHKLLGMIVDEHLTYEVHVDKLCIKLNFEATRPFTPY